ncbi:MAG: hypothetical protein EBZ48_12090 [Proteobacteria bacterium]|nr:hypothetical protein [Pseudomonadota bacterium]
MPPQAPDCIINDYAGGKRGSPCQDLHSGAGTDQTNLFKAGNWSPNGFSADNSDLIFTNANASSSLVLDVSSSATLNSITFGEGALSFTLTNSTSLLTLNGGTNITDNSTNLETLAVRIALAGDSVWNTGAGAQLLVSGNISQVGSTPFGITKIGNGMLTLSGVNTYTGGTTLSGGVMTLSGVAATLGSTNSSVTISSGTLDLGGFNRTNSSLTMNAGALTNGTLNAATYALNGGIVHANLGAGIINIGGNVTLTGTAAATRVNINSGTMILGGTNRLLSNATVALSNVATLNLGGYNQTLAGLSGSGSVTNSAGTLTLNATSGTVIYGGSITGSGNILKSGAFAQMLTGISAYRGTTMVTGGSLSLGTTGRLTQTASLTVTNGATLLLGSTQANSINTNAALNLGGGQLSMGGAGVGGNRAGGQTFASLTLTANSSIDFTTLSGTSSLYFSTIGGLSTYTLSIFNWNGTNLYGQSSATGGAGSMLQPMDPSPPVSEISAFTVEAPPPAPLWEKGPSVVLPRVDLLKLFLSPNQTSSLPPSCSLASCFTRKW